MNRSATVRRVGTGHQAIQLAVKELKKQLRHYPLVIQGAWDIGDRKSTGEIELGLISRIGQHAPCFLRRGINVIPFPCRLFSTDEVSIEIVKRAIALEEIVVPTAITMVNVAKIDGSRNGRRIDHLFFGVTEFNRIVFGYAAEDSAVLDQVLPFLKALYTFQTPEDWDRHAHFRSRTVLPHALARILTLAPEWLSLLTPVELETARAELKIVPVRNQRAWWYDSFGQDGAPLNIKTGILQNDRLLSGVDYGEKLLVQFGNDQPPKEVVYAESLQSANNQGLPVLSVASSGYQVPGRKAVHLMDIMVPQASAAEYFDYPDSGCPMFVRRSDSAIPVADGTTAAV